MLAIIMWAGATTPFPNGNPYRHVQMVYCTATTVTGSPDDAWGVISSIGEGNPAQSVIQRWGSPLS